MKLLLLTFSAVLGFAGILAGCLAMLLLVIVMVRFRGLAKNTAQLMTLFALSNLWMARRHLQATAGEVRL